MDMAVLNRALERVPRYMAEHVRAYVFERVPPSGFLRKVLENDLHGAASKADEANRAALFGWACVLDSLPVNCWGSIGKVSEYLERLERVGLPLPGE
jgi:hypothetical protein